MIVYKVVRTIYNGSPVSRHGIKKWHVSNFYSWCADVVYSVGNDVYPVVNGSPLFVFSKITYAIMLQPEVAYMGDRVLECESGDLFDVQDYMPNPSIMLYARERDTISNVWKTMKDIYPDNISTRTELNVDGVDIKVSTVPLGTVLLKSVKPIRLLDPQQVREIKKLESSEIL